MRLTVNNVSKSYKDNKALSGFTVDFQPGIYALLGPNGSGKSTLMNIITGNLGKDSGEILYSDGDITEDVRKMGDRFREKLGFMPQYPGMYPNFSISEFLWYMATLKNDGAGLKGEERKEHVRREIEEILSKLELSDVADRKIRALSGGMKQRVALAQATLGDPSIIILDEPTAGLDPKQRIAVRNYIASIAMHKIVIIATHVVPDVEYIAKDVIILKKGVIVAMASPEELAKSIEGKVWNVTVPEERVQEIQETAKVTNISKIEGGAALRILSDKKPDANAETVQPTLEDYYLYVFGEASVEPGK